MLHWYRIDSVLGQGGFGITYLATDTNLKQPAALKEYLPNEIAARLPDGAVLARSEQLDERYAWGLERFISEAQVLARFDHPNIVRVHSVFEHNNTAYMVMRYEQGENLESILSGGRQMAEEDLLELLLPVLDGLEAIHAEGFIHRDIKPDNIYVRDDGSPVLIDFGSARQASQTTRTITILVAPGYAPFEQYYDTASHQGPWTDIYSLGATLYRAVAGRPPVDAIARSRGVLGSTEDILVPAVEAGQGRFSPRFLTAIDHALSFAEEDRPQSIAQWRAEFADGPGGGNVTASAAPAIDVRPHVNPGEAQSPTQAPIRAREPARLETGTAPDTIRPRMRVPVGIWMIAVALLAALVAYLVAGRFPAHAPLASWPAADAPAASRPGARSSADEAATEQPSELAAALDTRRRALDEARATLELERQRLDARLAELADRERAAEQAETRLAERDRAIEQRLVRLEARSKDLDGLGAAQREESARLRAEREQLDRASATRDQVQALRSQLAALRSALDAARTPAGTGAAPGGTPVPAAAPATVAASIETPRTPTLEEALEALERDDYAAARQGFSALAEAGRPEARFQLALMHLSGQGGKADRARAIRLLTQAAEAGHAGAQLRLGQLHAATAGGAGLAAAARWFRDAATQGIPEAQLRLGRLYALGQGVAQDDFLAYTWLAAAAGSGEEAALALLEEVGGRLQAMEIEQARELARQYARPGAEGSR
jgi:TPR repeat protein